MSDFDGGLQQCLSLNVVCKNQDWIRTMIHFAFHERIRPSRSIRTSENTKLIPSILLNVQWWKIWFLSLTQPTPLWTFWRQERKDQLPLMRLHDPNQETPRQSKHWAIRNTPMREVFHTANTLFPLSKSILIQTALQWCRNSNVELSSTSSSLGSATDEILLLTDIFRVIRQTVFDEIVHYENLRSTNRSRVLTFQPSRFLRAYLWAILSRWFLLLLFSFSSTPLE